MLEYSQCEIPGLAPDETGYQITGTLQCASVRLTRAVGVAGSMFGFTACAFALDVEGIPTITAAGQTIEGWHTVSCMKRDLIIDGELSQTKIDELKAAAIEAALSEMLSVTTVEQAFDALGV